MQLKNMMPVAGSVNRLSYFGSWAAPKMNDDKGVHPEFFEVAESAPKWIDVPIMSRLNGNGHPIS
jgi:hypothetical protein